MNVQLAGTPARSYAASSVGETSDEVLEDSAVFGFGCECNGSGTEPLRSAWEDDVGIASNTPQCPAIRYLFRGVEENPIGYVWFADASGMSKATGTMNFASGRFHLTLTSLDGQGPIGEVDGTKDPGTGVVTAVLDGPGCSKLKLPPTNPYVRKADGTD